MKTVDEIMALVVAFAADYSKCTPESYRDHYAVIEAALKKREGGASISTEHGPWKPSTYPGEEGEQYCARCMLRDKFLGSRACTPHIVYTAPPKAQPMSSEKEIAICEGHFNQDSEAYFSARPQLDSTENRRIFYAGHRKGWLSGLDHKITGD